MDEDIQDRVDAYLRGEMNNESRIEFERELESNEALAKTYRETKAISNAIADRMEKLNMMALWDKEEEIKQQQIRRRDNIRRWTIGMSAVACIAVGFFAIRPMFVATSSSPTSEFIMPNFENEVYYRGGDSSMEILDSLIAVKEYDTALIYADSLISKFSDELKEYQVMDTLTEKDEANKEFYEEGLDDLEWRRANLLIALGKSNEAKECLKRIVGNNGYYNVQADSLLRTLLVK